MKIARVSTFSLMIMPLVSLAAVGYQDLKINKSTVIPEGEIYNSILIEDSFSDIGDVIQTVVQIDGATVVFLYGATGSRLEINGVRGHRIWMAQESSLIVSGGSFDLIAGEDDSRLDLYDITGEHPCLSLQDQSQGNFYGGQLEAFCGFDKSEGSMYGGFIEYSVINHFSRFHLLGGVVNFMAVIGQSQVHLFGGEIEDGLVADEFGEIHLYGSGFAYEALSGNYDGGLVSGLWQDGTPFSISLDNGLVGNTYDHIIFHEIPEPGSLVLLGCGGLLLRHRRKTKILS